ncbi:hypothetical protein DA096_15315 [Vibrio rotiferianus]|uniref:prepilin-type N-terminal cleavage/methylation domain-containing protein n=1 Tax=Vibrio harveyi group TaxID=717610 RepID=UPI0011107282|nr:MULTISPECIES: prepilin-type N-terminal cleavage/methylation domain-containing protein [Vibrio harveyi group]NOH65203.1 prepilin-type N-terminal cleavage/methylation domain-containing protein [Vibrio rotiferianus]TMX44364.1 hypothetical protein DA095_00765 [Vibrio rotiferianus]TMX48759.1 hypothetical protein DA093_15835 [Vibrio rotiferianus]TMX58633.1 hypothetical protein DA097_20015 [Vibrio rotiferianus]TMX61985.1 hypothetical protein DA096_15315 [Vibrio rotiferianus]
MKTNQISGSKGFTLLEVLIASLIIFAAIALTSVVYSNSLSSSLKAQRAVKIATILPIMQDSIASELMLSKERTGSGKGALAEVTYEWKAKVNKQEELVGDIMSERLTGRFAILWDVELSITYQNIIRIYDYQEFSVR